MEKDAICHLLEVSKVFLMAFLHVVLPKGNAVNIYTIPNQYTANIPCDLTGTKKKKRGGKERKSKKHKTKPTNQKTPP